MVYKVERDTGDHIAIGVVIGSVANHPDMYRAAILSWNLRELQNQEALKISGVKLMRPMSDKHPELVPDELLEGTWSISQPLIIKLSCSLIAVSIGIYLLYKSYPKK